MGSLSLIIVLIIVVWVIVLNSHVTSRELFQPVALRGAEFEYLHFTSGHIEGGIGGQEAGTNVLPVWTQRHSARI